ncbi:MAG: hypothetical protein L0H83_09430, partial [Salinisphaera sp.]|nr:hypothetical protein [Salinisphaera sp.]
MAKSGRRSGEKSARRGKSRRQRYRQDRNGWPANTRRGMTRRQFLTRTAAAGMMLAVPSLFACAGEKFTRNQPPRPKEQRTLFFNLSHENHAGKTYFLTGGGHRYKLTEVSGQPDVLRQVRKTHAFLRAVPDSHITHHVENAMFASDTVTLCYVSADTDTQAGTWSMSAVQLYIPPSGAAHAYAQARKARPSGPLPLSAKRKYYGIASAQTEQDLREERDLLDPVSHAATMVGCHPDLMSLEPNSAHTIHSNHVDHSIDIVLLSQKLNQSQYGPAMPQQTPGQPNATGWGTLQPVPGDGGVPLKNVTGQHAGRIQYQPSLHPDLRTLAGSAMNSTTLGVKDDTSLGADATGLTPAGPNDSQNPALTGKMWLRHDGLTKVDQ